MYDFQLMKRQKFNTKSKYFKKGLIIFQMRMYFEELKKEISNIHSFKSGFKLKLLQYFSMKFKNHKISQIFEIEIQLGF